MASRTSSLSHTEALYIIDRLIAERRISPAMVARIRSEMASEIQQLEERLASLRGEPKGSAKRRSALSTSRQKLSAETQASRRLQGTYLNLIRRVPTNQRGQFKQIARTKGREDAIKALRSFLDR